MQNYILAIDIGTTSTKGLAVLADGTILSQSQKEYSTFYPEPGYAEQDADEIFLAVVEVIGNVVEQSGTAGLLAVSFSCAMHSLVLVDEGGIPLTNLIIWADTRSAEQANRIRASGLWKKFHDLSGTPIHPMAPLCKLMWIKENQRQTFTTAHKFISIKEYVFARLFGEYVVDYSIASGGGLFDHRQLKWSPDILDWAGIPEAKLSRLVPTFTRFSGLPAIWSEQMKIPADTEFIIGASDGCLAHLGCGAMNPGELSVTIGTSGAARMAASSARHDEQCRVFNYRLDEERYVVGGATNNGAVLLSWFAENIELNKLNSQEFIRDAFSVGSSEGLIFLPYLLGERAPIYDAHARGVFFGIGMHHNRSHFKRALLEGICWGLKSIMIALEETVEPVTRVIASGGFVHSDQWVQLLADILGKPIEVNSQNDASSLGAALVGFQALGLKTDFKQSGGKTFQPDKKNVEHEQKLFEIVESLYDHLKGDFARLNDLNHFVSQKE